MSKILTSLIAFSLLFAAPVRADIGTAFDTITSSVEQARNLSDAQTNALSAAQADLATKQAALEAAKQKSDTDADTIKALEAQIASQQTLIAKLRTLAPAPTVSLIANPATINAGQSSTLALSAVNTETCVPTGWDMLKPTVTPPNATTYRVDCVGWNGAAVFAEAPVAVTVPTPPPPPDPVPTPSAANTLTITNKSGVAQANYPFQFGRPFICGEIAHYPQPLLNGTAVVAWQSEVKNRCPDGSVKFAVISAVFPTLPIGAPQIVTFQDSPSGNNAPIAAADLLAQFPDFDAAIKLTKPATLTGNFEPDLTSWKKITNGSLTVIVDGVTYNITGINFSTLPANFGYFYTFALSPALQANHVPFTFATTPTQTILTGGKTISLGTPASGQDIGPLLFKSDVTSAPPPAVVSVSARKMLEDGNCKTWTSGPVAQTMICADRTTARVYDLDPTGNGWKPFHPEFVLTFWPATKQVFVRYVGEISNTQALEAFTADIKLTTGKANPAAIYQQDAVPHSIATRWTRRTWIGGAPESKIDIDHNIGYLADTNWLPNFDRSLKIPESVLADNYAGWQTTDRKITGPGWWLKGMPNVAYHPDIGHMPLWYNRALMSRGDWRAREVMFSQADLAGGFPMQLREGDPAKKADRAQTVPSIGQPITVYARPWSWVFDERVWQPAVDKIVVHSPRSATTSLDTYQFSDFATDNAHQPDPFFVPYMLTGDPFYYDGLLFWAAMNAFEDNPDYRNGGNAVIYDQPRGEAWNLRTRLHAALAATDDDPMKAIFNAYIDDAIAYWEAKRGIKGTKYENTPLYKWAATTVGTKGDGWQGMGPHPLGWWQLGFGPGSGAWDCTGNAAVFNTSVCYSTNAPWQQDFLIIELGRAAELGYATNKLFAYASGTIIGQLTADGYNSRMFGQYQIPDAKKDPSSPTGYTYFQNWKDVMTAWNPTFGNSKDIAYWPNTGREFYWDVARGAAGMASSLPATDKLPSGAAAWGKLNDLIAAQTAQTGQAPDWNIDPTWAIVPRKDSTLH